MGWARTNVSYLFFGGWPPHDRWLSLKPAFAGVCPVVGFEPVSTGHVPANVPALAGTIFGFYAGDTTPDTYSLCSLQLEGDAGPILAPNEECVTQIKL